MPPKTSPDSALPPAAPAPAEEFVFGEEPAEVSFFDEEPLAAAAPPPPLPAAKKPAAKAKPAATGKAEPAAAAPSASSSSDPAAFRADETGVATTPAASGADAEGYVVLARRYRPQTFDELVGQDAAQQALRTAIERRQIAQAYLFSGPRGTGKTSTARILAKSVNCQNGGPRPDPCGQCESCMLITAGTSLDVIEIDAASNTGVDNIRDLRSGVALAPFSRYKVYIIDEVHMLSTAAFNALLKTLEEPPAQVIFVLATTELHKVPDTIISRCQSYQFRRFQLEEITGQLSYIMDRELASRGLRCAPEDKQKILALLARNSEGGMRDAQVALDQVLVLSRDVLDYELVRQFLGQASNDQIDVFLRALFERRGPDLLQIIAETAASGQDLTLFVKSIVAHVRDVLLVAMAGPQAPTLLDVSTERMTQMGALAKHVSSGWLIAASELLLRLHDDMRAGSQPRFLLELACLRLCLLRDESGEDSDGGLVKKKVA